MVECIHYQSGYKYQLKRAVSIQTELQPDGDKAIGDFVKLGADGLLELRNGYAWDGPSGPTIDTKTFMRGSLVHDALYQLMRAGVLDAEQWRKPADKELKRLCGIDGMNPLRAAWVYLAVQWFARKAASEEGRKPMHAAPKNCTDSE